jgi:UDP-N-acetylglucosamine 2-epimerase
MKLHLQVIFVCFNDLIIRLLMIKLYAIFFVSLIHQQKTYHKRDEIFQKKRTISLLAAVGEIYECLQRINVFINRKENYTIRENRQEIFSSSSARLISPFFYLSCRKKNNLCSFLLSSLY